MAKSYYYFPALIKIITFNRPIHERTILTIAGTSSGPLLAQRPTTEL